MISKITVSKKNYSKTWLISFGVIDLPDNLRKSISGFIKNDTPTTEIKKRRKLLSEEKRLLLLDNINLALKKNIIKFKDIWAYLVQKEFDTGQKIILRTRSGDLMAESTFNGYVMSQKRVSGIKEPSVRLRIIALHNEGVSDSDIKDKIGCTQAHVRRCLIDAGLIAKTTPPKRTRSNIKRKSY